MSILFINGSPSKHGNTAALAAEPMCSLMIRKT